MGDVTPVARRKVPWKTWSTWRSWRSIEIAGLARVGVTVGIKKLPGTVVKLLVAKTGLGVFADAFVN